MHIHLSMKPRQARHARVGAFYRVPPQTGAASATVVSFCDAAWRMDMVGDRVRGGRRKVTNDVRAAPVPNWFFEAMLPRGVHARIIRNARNFTLSGHLAQLARLLGSSGDVGGRSQSFGYGSVSTFGGQVRTAHRRRGAIHRASWPYGQAPARSDWKYRNYQRGRMSPRVRRLQTSLEVSLVETELTGLLQRVGAQA
jgi:hypothetical protein